MDERLNILLGKLQEDSFFFLPIIIENSLAFNN